jgi:D-lyxose ketol-isomerase
MKVIKQITKAMGAILDFFFKSDMDVMSSEAKKILANKEDRQKYIEAIDKIKLEPDKSITIILSTKEKITLIS